MLPFIKMHGAGNDYVYVDCFTHPVPERLEDFARRVSDRHTGIGSDGLVLMLPPDTPGVTARMRMFNADGSEGSLCGNALRCMAMWLHQTGRCERSCRIAMMDRVIGATIVSSDAIREVAIVRMAVGEPVRHVPEESAARLGAGIGRLVDPGDLMLPELIHPATEVSMGNSHTVLFVKSLANCDVHGLGRLIEHHPQYPHRTNVEFVERVAGRVFRARVWERGSGETQACGSGACAIGVAAILHGVCHRDEEIAVHMPGGELRVRWREDNVVELEGPAAVSFRGEWPGVSV